MEDDRRRAAWKRKFSGGHFVQHYAKREQVGPRIQFFPARLLGRHVRNRAQRRAGAGQVLFGRSGQLRSLDDGGSVVSSAYLGLNKIQNLRLPASRYEQLRRPEV